MDRKFRAILAAALIAMAIPGCSDDTSEFSSISSSETASVSNNAAYFDSNERINKLFSDYNSLAEIPITADMIEQGNIKTKAHVYIDSISIAAIDVGGRISIRLDAKPEDDLYPFFRDFVQSINPDFSIDRVEQAWDDINEKYYEIDRNETGRPDVYEELGIQMSFGKSPSKSWFELWEVDLDV